MKKPEIFLETCCSFTMYGLHMPSNDRTIHRDIPRLTDRYYKTISTTAGSVLPLYILTRNYIPSNGNFDLFIGSDSVHQGLESLLIETCFTAKITVRPKWGLFWGLAIGWTKRYFYTQWLPASGYEPLNWEYELHSHQSTEKKPSIEMVFGIRKAS